MHGTNVGGVGGVGGSIVVLTDSRWMFISRLLVLERIINDSDYWSIQCVDVY